MYVNIPNGRKIYQHFPISGPTKITLIGIFGLKINHLATLRLTYFSEIGGGRETVFWQVRFSACHDLMTGFASGVFFLSLGRLFVLLIELSKIPPKNHFHLHTYVRTCPASTLQSHKRKLPMV
jgi:hypothetical protein